jgi:DNA-binding NtrC family response regulator
MFFSSALPTMATTDTMLHLGASAASRAFAVRLEQVSGTHVTVWLRGESGSGKNLAARALHAASSRAGGPLVVVSLAALSPTLMEAELFGHEEGAFTGAHRARSGRFRQADGGTLVLDDIDALPLETQAKLLRVIQERVVEPLGAEGPLPIDVRLVCTTVRDLRELVEQGGFRSDLYWRLAVVELVVPPLRARMDDLPDLIANITRRLAREHNVVPRRLSDEALERLRAYPWPGNVRELENALERALVFAPPSDEAGAEIRAGDFEFLGASTLDAADDLAGRALSHGLKLEDVERALIERAMREQRGNLTAAARQIGLTRRALEYRLARGREDAAARGGTT